ncbi:MAG: family 4C encapsulin nanocompartment shell protein [Bacteroidota bacterium]
MLVLESAPDTNQILPFIGESATALRDAGLEPRTILVGPLAYTRLREAVATQFNRENQHVEQVQWLTVVVDPGRGDRVCVVPPPRESNDLRLESR